MEFVQPATHYIVASGGGGQSPSRGCRLRIRCMNVFWVVEYRLQPLRIPTENAQYQYSLDKSTGCSGPRSPGDPWWGGEDMHSGLRISCGNSVYRGYNIFVHQLQYSIAKK